MRSCALYLQLLVLVSALLMVVCMSSALPQQQNQYYANNNNNRNQYNSLQVQPLTPPIANQQQYRPQQVSGVSLFVLVIWLLIWFPWFSASNHHSRISKGISCQLPHIRTIFRMMAVTRTASQPPMDSNNKLKDISKIRVSRMPRHRSYKDLIPIHLLMVSRSLSHM